MSSLAARAAFVDGTGPRPLLIYRAQAIGPRPVEKVVISIVPEFPSGLSLEDSMHLHERSAKEIADALFGSLPGGTCDALLREMLLRRASQLQVAFTTITKEVTNGE